MLKKNLFSKALVGVLLIALFVGSAVIGIDNNGINLETTKASTKDAPKYVFYFIGDGLGASQRQIAEYFLQEKTGDESEKLLMNTLPFTGINTTYSADTLVTDSAAAGTALATGYKTNNKVISKLPDGTDVKTLVEAAEEKGLATGVVSSTRLTHATPAVFASHNESRYNENEIAADFLDSGVEYFAGGGNRHFVPSNWEWGKSKRKDERNILTEFYHEGYEVFESSERTKDFRNYKPEGKDKVIATFGYSHLPYEIDRLQDNNTPSLAELTDKGIEVLSQYEDGFFMMIEGGRIDHACHANDPVGAIYDTIAFDNAIKEAYEFYQEHPEETLIVVVGDHETGGMGLGFGDNYFLDMASLLDAKASLADNMMRYQGGGDHQEFYNYIAKNYGLTDLTESEQAEIEKALTMVDKGVEADAAVYGNYNVKTPYAIAVAHILSERAGVAWTTYAHSATQIPMSAIGQGASNFSGFKDNTEIARTMADILGLELTK